MKKLTLLCLMLIPLVAMSQSTYEYDELDNKPMFEKGNKYLDSLFNIYFNATEITDTSAEKSGFVNLEVTVNADGTVSSVTIKDDSMYAGFAEECVRVFELIGKNFKYEAGEKDGAKVWYSRTLTIDFYTCSNTPNGYLIVISKERITEAKLPEEVSNLDSYIMSNFNMPYEAIGVSMRGKILAEYEIDEGGNMINIKIIKDELGYGCGEEFLRILNKLAEKKWTPAMLNGCPVNSGIKYRYPLMINQQ